MMLSSLSLTKSLFALPSLPRIPEFCLFLPLLGIIGRDNSGEVLSVGLSPERKETKPVENFSRECLPFAKHFVVTAEI